MSNRSPVQHKLVPLTEVGDTIEEIIQEIRDQHTALIDEHLNVEITQTSIDWEGCLCFRYTYEMSAEEVAEELAWTRKWKTKQIEEKKAEIAKLEEELNG